MRIKNSHSISVQPVLCSRIFRLRSQVITKMTFCVSYNITQYTTTYMYYNVYLLTKRYFTNNYKNKLKSDPYVFLPHILAAYAFSFDQYKLNPFLPQAKVWTSFPKIVLEVCITQKWFLPQVINNHKN